MDLQEFREFIGHEPLPVLIEFCAPWCKPCQLMEPDLEAQAEKYHGQVVVRTVNVMEHRDVAIGLRIMGVPTLVLFKNGEEVLRRIGMQSPRALGQLFEFAVAKEASPSGEPAKRPAAQPDSLTVWLRLVSGLVLMTLGIWLNLWWVALVGGLILLWSAPRRWSAVSDRLLSVINRKRAAPKSTEEKSSSQAV